MVISDTDLQLNNKLLEEIIKSTGRFALAFSGGVDSSYLLSESIRMLGPGNVLAVLVSSALHPETESEAAALIAGKLGAKLIVLTLDLLKAAEVANNDAERCYYCKKALFKELIEAAGKEGFITVVDGTNADDANRHRPGLRALKELGVRSPLQEAGLGKAEIRQLAKEAGLPIWNKPAAPCLATRFPVGTKITVRALKSVAAAEAMLRDLQVEGDLRVRIHGDLLRIEAEASSLKKLLELRGIFTSRLKTLGFSYVTLDLEGYRMGSMEQLSDKKA
ncbi:MAG: ATP-dependent sacrificial sulfur transferase LarE [Firmicutes bacterium]|nr:ATP-dependent sacrificial sulfur transferase LarE [Bacillota bacterium]